MIASLRILGMFAVLTFIATLPASAKSERDAIIERALSFYDSPKFRFTGPGQYRCSDLPFSKNFTKDLSNLICPHLDFQIYIATLPNPDQEKRLPCGRIFVGPSEGITGYQLKSFTRNGNRASVIMQLSHSSFLGQDKWQNKLLLVRESGGWKLDDIIFWSASDDPTSLQERIKMRVEENRGYDSYPSSK